MSIVVRSVRFAGFAVVLVALLLAARTQTFAVEPRVVAAKPEAVAWWDCRFGPVPGRETVHLLLMTSGDRVVRGVVEPYGMLSVDVSGLKSDGIRLAGRLVVGHDPTGNSKSVPRLASRMPLEIDLVHEGDAVSGTFRGRWPKNDKTTTDPGDVQGTVSGVRRDAARLARDFALAPDAAWPGWLGPNQNFSSGPASRPLVEDLSRARLVWASEAIGPTESGSQRYGACVGMPPCAGGASPVVSGGRVYQFRYRATGDAYQSHLDVQLAGERGPEGRRKMAEVGWTEADMRRRWAIDADEELVCLDAATGATLWTVVWPGEGIHLYDHKCSLTNHTPVVAHGRVFVFGALGIVRAVDAASGRSLWRTELPGYSDFMRKFKADALAKRNVAAPTRSFCHALNVSGRTLLAPDGIGACGTVGIDVDSGTVLWRVEKTLGKCVTPMAWHHGGRDFAIAADESGTIACLDARDGTTAWRTTEAGDNEYQTLLVGDRLIAHRLTKEGRTTAPRTDDPGPHSAPGENYGQLACWRISPTGATLEWTAPAEWGAPSNCPIGSAANGLVCFRGNYSYHLVKPETGEKLASRHLPEPVRWDEGHLLALPDRFVLHPDCQHGVTKMFSFPADADATIGPLWLPPHPPATTYQSAMSHAWADGRLLLRGCDAVYCYDLRR